MRHRDNGISQILPTLAVFFVFLVTPLGVAGQNIGLGLGLLIFLYWLIKERHAGTPFLSSAQTARQFLTLWGIFVIPIVIATLRRSDGSSALRFLVGHALSGVMVLTALRLRSVKVNRTLLLNTASLLIGLVGIVATSQMIFGWKLNGMEVVSQIKRAQGFYSHPLTLAYVALVIMPWSFARVMARPREWQSWFISIGVLLTILSTQSVTVISVSTITALFLMLKLLTKRQILLVGIASSLMAASVISIPNPIQEKFEMVLSGKRSDRETPYPDDRMAFWHAHWEMVKDDPWLGHGTGLESTDRQPYYEKIGLGRLKRMYEAHNMFLQTMVEGGIISLIGLVGFLIWWFLRLKSSLTTELWYRYAMLCTPVAFSMGALTQNAIQDSEVRYALLLVCSCGLWFSKENNSRFDA